MRKKYILAILIVLGLYQFVLLSNSFEVFFISLVFSFSFGFLFYKSFYFENMILRFFYFFTFFAHGIGAPLFWLNKEKYTYGGFGAVKDFDFKLESYLEIYLYVFSLFVFVFLSTIYFDNLKKRFFKTPKNAIFNSNDFSEMTERKFSQNNLINFADINIFLLIFLVGIPLNIFMALNQIGTMGVSREPLPFRIVGVMHYTRLLFIPILMLWLYSKSTQRYWVFFSILSYAFISSISAASRTGLLINLTPVVYHTISIKKKIRCLILLSFSIVALVFINASRDYSFSAERGDFSYFKAIEYAINFLFDPESPSIGLLDIIMGASNRFFGAQDMILAFQYQPNSPFLSFFNYFWCGGRSDSVVPDIGIELYDMTFDDSSGFGVGLGIVAFLLIFSKTNFILLLLGPLVLGFLISCGHSIATWFFSITKVNISLQLFICMIMAFTIYSSSLNMYYGIIELLILFGLISFFSQKILVINFNNNVATNKVQ